MTVYRAADGARNSWILACDDSSNTPWRAKERRSHGYQARNVVVVPVVEQIAPRDQPAHTVSQDVNMGVFAVDLQDAVDILLQLASTLRIALTPVVGEDE